MDNNVAINRRSNVESTLEIEQSISLWKHYNDQINGIDSRLTVSATLVFGASAILSSFVHNIVYVFPALSVILLYYLAYQLRVIELLRGYLLFIEEELIERTNNTAYSWNRFGVMINYNVPYFRSQKLSAFFFLMILGVASLTSFVMMFLNKESPFFVIPYLAICFFLGLFFALDLKDNKHISLTIYEKLKSGDISKQPSLNRKEVKNSLKNLK